VKLQEELKDSGFVIIGAHSQGGTADEIAKVSRGLKINFTVTNQFEIPGEKVEGLPSQFLFDSSGKLVAKDHHLSPGQIRDLVTNEPHFLASGRTYKKHKAEAEMLKKTKAYGSILKKLEKDLKGTGEAAEEAKYLTERIQAFGEKKLEEAKQAESDDAFLAHQSYTDLAANWKGAEIGAKATARLKELKDDKAFQEELKAGKMLAQIVAECGKLVAQNGKIKLDYGPNQKVAATVKASALALKKNHPKSKAAEKLSSVLEDFGFKGI